MTEIMLEHALKEWPIKRLGQLFRERKETVSDRDFPALSVTKKGIVPQLETAAKSDDSDNRKGVYAGDFVINSRSDRKGSSGLSEFKGSVSLINIVLEPKGIDPRFAHYLLRSSAFQEEFYRWGHGIVADLWTTRFSEMKNIRVSIPNLETQKTIAAFLDRETVRIDQLIEKKQRFLNVARERWQATLNHTLFPSSPDWKCLPSGWRQVRLKYLTDPNRPIMYGIVLPGPNMDEGPMIVKGGDVKPDRLRPDRLCRTTSEIEAGYARSRLKAGDLVISIRGGIGDVEIVPPEIAGANLTQDAARIAPVNSINREWLRYSLLSSAVFHPLEARSLGAAVRGINIFDLKRVFIPVPPSSNQAAIAKTLKIQEDRLRKLRVKVELHTNRIREFRAALITAAVTGQLDIRDKLPSVTTIPDRSKFRLLVGAEIIHRHQNIKRFGRIKTQKLLYLAEAHAGIDELGGNYLRWAAGPYDATLTDEVERAIEAASFFRSQSADGGNQGIAYVPLSKAGQHSSDLKALLGGRLDALRKTIDLLHDFETESVEAIATLYAVWNDALIDGETPDDERIIRGVLNEWHEKKAEKFKKADLEDWLDWMRRKGLVPHGQGPRTIPTMTGDLFR